MDTKVKQFIDCNRDNISSVYNFVCSSGETVVYIFFKQQHCERLELLTEARANAVSPYPLSVERALEQTMRECVGEYVEI